MIHAVAPSTEQRQTHSKAENKPLQKRQVSPKRKPKKPPYKDAHPLPIDNRLLLPLNRACEYVGVSRSKMYNLIAEGKVASVKIDGLHQVKVASLHVLVNDASKETALHPSRR